MSDLIEKYGQSNAQVIQQSLEKVDAQTIAKLNENDFRLFTNSFVNSLTLGDLQANAQLAQ
jgi:hypothetical protein